MPMILTVDANGSPFSANASTVDLSEIGARIKTTLGLAAGQPVNVIVPERQSDAAPGRVVWVGAQTQGAREVGIEFLSQLNEAQVRPQP